MRHPLMIATLVVLLPLTLAAGTAHGGSTRVHAPLECTKGSSDAHLDVSVTVPGSAAPGATFTVRIDGASSGAISQVGLNYLHDSVTDYIIPTGTTYVEGSAALVPDTGTENVRAGAGVIYRGGLVRLTLPGKVENGASYTPPSIEFKVVVAAPAGESLVLGFSQYRLMVNAVVIGDLKVTCNPKPRPFPLATIRVVAP